MRERSPSVLVVDDEPGMLDLLSVSLRQQGLEVLVAEDGEEALWRVRDARPDLVLLDLGLPDLDGFDVLAQIRATSAVPVIVVTVRSDEQDRIHGLGLGADDYVTKPFSPAELAARIRAVLRRVGPVTDALRAGLVRVDDYLEIDFDERQALVEGRRVSLRPTEYRLLYQLVHHAGQTVPFETILARVWGPEYRDEAHYVHLYITYLRQKIEPNPSNPRYILTRRGIGYSFCPVPRPDDPLAD
jgi:two-component system KDP operon response regulator KdpE